MNFDPPLNVRSDDPDPVRPSRTGVPAAALGEADVGNGSGEAVRTNIGLSTEVGVEIREWMLGIERAGVVIGSNLTLDAESLDAKEVIGGRMGV